MSRVTSLRKKALQHKLDRERRKEKNRRPISRAGSVLTPKRNAAWEKASAVRSQLSHGEADVR